MAIPESRSGRLLPRIGLLAVLLGIALLIAFRIRNSGGPQSGLEDRSSSPAPDQPGTESAKPSNSRTHDPAGADSTPAPEGPRKAVLQGRVADAVTGVPLAGATVVGRGKWGSGQEQENFSVLADEAGRYRVELAGGEYDVNASADGYVPAQAEWR